MTPDPGVIEVNVHPAHNWERIGRHHRRRLRRRASSRAWAPKSSISTARTPAPAAAITWCSAAPRRPTARSCGGPICCAAWSAYWHNHPSLSYLFSGTVHRPDEPGAARRRRPPRRRYELEIAFEQVPAGGTLPALAGRSRVPPFAGRRHGQHAPRRILHRQAVLARHAAGRLGLVEFRGVRDAAARADEPGAATAAAVPAWPGSGRRRIASRWSTGTRRCTTASCCRISSRHDFRRRDRRDCRRPATTCECDWFAPHFEFRFPFIGEFIAAQRPRGAAQGDRAVVRAGRGAGRRRHGPLRRFVGRAAAGESRRA